MDREEIGLVSTNYGKRPEQECGRIASTVTTMYKDQQCSSSKHELKTLSCLTKSTPVTIEFSDIHYSVPIGPGLAGRKDILQGVSGIFSSGELTAVMGSSGAGKSTLIDVLAGFVTTGVSGTIKVNGLPRQTKKFRKLSSYIMQDDLVQPYLTVGESMSIAAELKLGNRLDKEKKSEIVFEILETLGLQKCYGTSCDKLSGGQRKRLGMALELVSNPAVLFLDEPTTGLDTVSANIVIRLMSKLARQGRTVICTIHQPSASIFELFDKVYIVSRGRCVYQGSHDRLVYFLHSVGFHCPITHNPADFVMEVIQSDEDKNSIVLSNEIENGKVSLDKMREKKSASFTPDEDDGPSDQFSATFTKQCSILLRRRMKQQFRNTATLWLMVIHHIASGSFLGSIFLGVGKDASRPFDNFKFIISVVVFFMYTHVMCPALLFPAEVRLLRREYFNRWYSLKAYFVALTLSTLPGHILLGFTITAICYVLSGQPLEIFRYLLFTSVGLLLGLASEGWGLAIGAVFNEMNGSIVGPASIVPLLAVSVYGMGFGAVVEPVMRFLMSASYLRYGIVGFTSALYGFNRSALHCDYQTRDYCHYKDPALLMKDLGMEGLTFTSQLVALVVFLIFHRILAFLCLRCRLTSGFFSSIFIYTQKLLRIK